MNSNKRIKYIFASFFIFLGLIVLSVFVHMDSFRNFDYSSIINIQKFQNPIFDYLSSVFTLLGASESILLLVILVFTGLTIAKKKYVFSIFLFALIYPFELLGKLMIYHPKPPLILNRYVFDFHLPSSFVVETSYSFPSGHMARTAFLVSFIFIMLLNSKKKTSVKGKSEILLFIYLLLMFVSRIYLAEHWFSDVLGGTLLGFSIALLSYALW